MKGDYSKILEIAKYDPGVMRSREAFCRDDRQKHLENCTKEHEKFHNLVNSLSVEAREEIGEYAKKIDEKFERNRDFYKGLYPKIFPKAKSGS